ncbi:HAD family hydrolase [Paenibacillus sp. BR1-192]|uniref:HAD family hydrolase n=1 Tax=Paenibacillus sp. BR1-192 TaxID=3032287 RepID=UPI00240DEBFA|nr:HAD family hydrolase [Paenibacillus sp. BR1-192]WFB56728.1 HAD family hydrolase [Paenibacillus sp. BR1-192]
MTVKSIIFDLDETLTDRRAAINTFIKRLIARYFPDSDEAAQMMIAKQFKEADHNGYRDKREVYKMLVEQLPWVNPPKADEYLSFFRGEIASCIQPMDQLVSVLRELKTWGLKLGIITNGTVQVQEGKIHQLGIREYFDSIVISEEAGVKKPDPAIFTRALSRLHAMPSETWYVGDHPHNDVIGAAQCGIKAIWYTRDGRWDDSLDVKPYRTIHKLEQLIPIYAEQHEGKCIR